MALPYGNRFDVVAVDQSDCFGGSSELARGTILEDGAQDRRAGYPCTFFDQLFLDYDGVTRLRKAANDIMQSASALHSSCSAAHEQWWEEAGVDAGRLLGWLDSRASRIADICRLKDWEDMRDAAKGGRNIKLNL